MQSKASLNRREFLGCLPVGAAYLLAHDALAIAAHRPGADVPGASATLQAGPVKADDGLLIQRLRLLTAAPLAEMRRFYHEKLHFPVEQSTDREITFVAGGTRLTFVTIRPEQVSGDGGRGRGEPIYHFAFNIPCNKIKAARLWQLERSALIAPRGGVREPDYPEDVWHFRHWNAHSLFFYDPAFNIVEYIARHTLDNAMPEPDRFSSAEILYASEIGFVFGRDEVAQASGMVEEKIGLHAYPAGTQPAWAMGDERGLILCLGRRGEMWGTNTETPVKWDVFPTEAVLRGPRSGDYAFKGYPYSIKVE